MEELETNEKTLEFLAEKSSRLLNEQINGYRQQPAKSATIITLLVLFIPLYLNGFEESSCSMKIIALIPTILLIITIILLVLVLKRRSLSIGNNGETIIASAGKSYTDVLKEEIGANTTSYKLNLEHITKSDKLYSRAINLTLISIILATIVLLINQFFH